MSLAVVDERPGMEAELLVREEELLRPVYAAYSWSPIEPAGKDNDGRQLLEQAMFAALLAPAPARPIATAACSTWS